MLSYIMCSLHIESTDSMIHDSQDVHVMRTYKVIFVKELNDDGGWALSKSLKFPIQLYLPEYQGLIPHWRNSLIHNAGAGTRVGKCHHSIRICRVVCTHKDTYIIQMKSLLSWAISTFL